MQCEKKSLEDGRVCANCSLKWTADAAQWVECNTCVEKPAYCPKCMQTLVQHASYPQEREMSDALEGLQSFLDVTAEVWSVVLTSGEIKDATNDFYAIHHGHQLCAITRAPSAPPADQASSLFCAGEKDFWLDIMWEDEKRRSDPTLHCPICGKSWHEACACGREGLARRSSDEDVARFRERYRAQQTAQVDKEVTALEQKLDKAKKRKRALETEDWREAEKERAVAETIGICGHPTPFSTSSKCPVCVERDQPRITTYPPPPNCNPPYISPYLNPPYSPRTQPPLSSPFEGTWPPPPSPFEGDIPSAYPRHPLDFKP